MSIVSLAPFYIFNTMENEVIIAFDCLSVLYLNNSNIEPCWVKNRPNY